ncbi:hypothetical protein PN498_25415 [Oscillatoria sp. CS-180]|uniref:hypothetical protein n=1 Tax=Oscillatoria sp. CS-180 TaxID=3021720 RepID=UPI00232CF236|nr:hypothetical protein [Oscillatoria sp. CS-180]MDB9529357.1 hypothetical protein [Oscillatoria sp. CS-180]
MKAIAEQGHILTAEPKSLRRATVCQLIVSGKRVKSADPRQTTSSQKNTVFSGHIKPVRLAIAGLLILAMADLLPHPALSPGFISTSFSAVKQALQENIR